MDYLVLGQVRWSKPRTVWVRWYSVCVCVCVKIIVLIAGLIPLFLILQISMMLYEIRSHMVHSVCFVSIPFAVCLVRRGSLCR